MDNFDYLCEVFNDYCIKHKLPLDISADDMLHDFKYNKVNYYLSKPNLEWLNKFCKVWEELT